MVRRDINNSTDLASICFHLMIAYSLPTFLPSPSMPGATWPVPGPGFTHLRFRLPFLENLPGDLRSGKIFYENGNQPRFRAYIHVVWSLTRPIKGLLRLPVGKPVFSRIVKSKSHHGSAYNDLDVDLSKTPHSKYPLKPPIEIIYNCLRENADS